MNLPNLDKMLSCGFLIAVWLAMDVLKLQDDVLKYTIAGLLTVITGWSGLSSVQLKKDPS